MAASERDGHLLLALLQARVGRSVVSRLDGAVSPAEVLATPVAELSRRIGLTEKGLRALEELVRDFDAQALRSRLAGKGATVVTPADEDFPERLRSVPDPPPALFVVGSPSGAPFGAAACVALVGSRKASASGMETALRLGRALGERGVCVVSGLALGVDAAAHEGALCAGGPTVGVLGCGIDVVYPRDNRRLFERVRERGALVSEYYLGEPPRSWRFPARNRIIAGLCDAVVVVEAPQKSGALITARHAYESGRDVWAVPGPVEVPECRGSNRLLADGAGVLWDVSEFVEAVASRALSPELPVAEEGKPPDAGPVPAELPEGEAEALRGIGFGPTEVDVVATRSGVGMRELLPALTLLEIKGYVTRNAGGAYVRRATP